MYTAKYNIIYNALCYIHCMSYVVNTVQHLLYVVRCQYCTAFTVCCTQIIL